MRDSMARVGLLYWCVSVVDEFLVPAGLATGIEVILMPSAVGRAGRPGRAGAGTSIFR